MEVEMIETDKRNLLEETLEVLKYYDKTPSDVRWVGSPYNSFSWVDFEGLADFEYDSGYGENEISTELLVVGEDWWLERAEYDGSEWWEFKTTPIKPEVRNPRYPLTKIQKSELKTKLNILNSLVDGQIEISSPLVMGSTTHTFNGISITILED